MKQIFVVTPDEANACTFYRGLGVLGELRRHNIQIKLPSKYITWQDLCDCDLTFMQRPYTQKHVQIAQMAKQQTPLWIDYDDDLLNVPESNPSYELYSRNETRDVIAKLLELADIVTVSTKGVQDSFGGQIIPNAYNDYRLSTNFVSKFGDRKVILWRGTETHFADLFNAKDSLNHWTKEYPNFDFCFYGLNPWFLEPRDNIYYIPGQDIYSYFHSLEIISPVATIVPLKDNKLNRSKSNIAWLETARFGGKCFAPMFDEWDKPGIETFFTFKDFLESPPLKNPNAWNYIQANLLLSKVNQRRLAIVEEYTQ